MSEWSALNSVTLEFAKRGLAEADDEDRYRPAPGVPLSRGGGAYFTTDERYALVLAATRRYRRGVVVAELAATSFDTLRANGDILPDPLLPAHGWRVLPRGFGAFNLATSLPAGRRRYLGPGALLPGGRAVP